MGNSKINTNIQNRLVLILRSDFEIIQNVFKLQKDSKLSDNDVSFLLGKPNEYFFETLNPTEKQKFKQELLPLFVPIFQVPLVQILPSIDIDGTEEVKIFSSAKFNKKSTIYRFNVSYEDGTNSGPMEWTKKVVTGKRKKENKELTVYLKSLIDEGFFFRPKTALFVLIHLRKFFHKPFTVDDLSVSIRKLCRVQAGINTLLQRNVDHMRYTYSELFPISSLDDVSTLPVALHEALSKIPVTNRYIISHATQGILGIVELNDRELVNIVIHPDFQNMRLASRLLDYARALNKKLPLTAELSVDSPMLDFLTNCSFSESKEDKEFRDKHKLSTIKLKRGTEKEVSTT